MQYQLTQNAIMHITAGFDGPFTLQVFSLRKQPNNPQILNMCLTDGQIYIGAIYNAPRFFDLENYHIVKITAQYFDRSKPIIIKTLEIVSKGHRKLIGNPPSTLTDFFNKEVNYFPQSQPKKKIKPNFDQFTPVIIPDHKQTKDQIIFKENNNMMIKLQKNNEKNQKNNSQSKHNNDKKSNSISNYNDNNNNNNKINSINTQPKQSINNNINAPNNNNNNESKFLKKLRFASSSQSQQCQYPESSADNFKANFIKQPPPSTSTPHTPINLQDMIQNSFIRDLFQRHTGWVMLCRVNYRSLAKCENGLYAVNFVLSDQSSDQIKCVCFQASIQKAKEMLKVGKYYLFTGGEIKETKDQELQIIFDRNSHFIQKTNAIFQINPKKITRIDKIIEEQPQTEINVIGIIRKIQNKGQMLKTKKRYKATICDPITNYQIDFLLFLNQDQKPIQKGMVVVLHSYQIYKQGHIYKLNSSYRSYYFQQKANNKLQDKNNLVNQFHKALQQTGWDNEHYKNLSMFPFTPRSINQLKNIYKKTEDDKIYTALDCWVMQISKKKSYYACKTCKKPTQKKQMGLFQCSHCRKIVQVTLTYTLSVTFTDYTGSITIDAIGQHAQNMMQKKALQYYSLPTDEQNNHLQSLRYKNVQLKIKTEKKSDNKLTHSVWGIQRPTPEGCLKEIKKLLDEKSVKLDDKW